MGEALGRKLLRLDAAYCAAGGALTLLLLAPLGSLLGAPRTLLAAAAVVAIGWALVLARLAGAAGWRVAVAAVAAANVAAAATVGAVGAASPELAARVLLFAVALEITAFAAAQLASLAR